MDLNQKVSIEKLETLLGYPVAGNEVHTTHEETEVRLVIEFANKAASGIRLAVITGETNTWVLGRILDLDCSISSSGGCVLKVRTRSRHTADMLSLFYPMTQVTFEPLETELKNSAESILAFLDGRWELDPDLELLEVTEGVSVYLRLKNRRTQGIIQVPATAKLEEMIPHII
jgi:hypothetical protein